MSETDWQLRTERLLVRAMVAADAADLAERRSDPETARYQSWSTPYPLDRALALIADVEALGQPTPGHWFQWAIERIDDGVVLGDVALHIDDDARNGEFGITLHRWARGHGYATEAARAVIDYGFLAKGLHRIEASVDPRNLACVSLLTRLGMRHEGTSIESYWKEGIVSDDAHYAILAREWPAARSPLASS